MRYIIVIYSALFLLLMAACATAPVRKPVMEKDPVPMVLIPKTEFRMGADDGEPDERPAHPVKVNAFYMDIHEVTIAQYTKFLNETGLPKPDFWQPELDKPNDPVVGITWQEASAYAAWTGKRLPTEAEWECAARGVSGKNRFPWGQEPDVRFGNYNSFGIMPVMSFPQNSYNLYDLGGNVWEWCNDWYHNRYYTTSKKTVPQGPPSGTHKVLRGGAWYCTPQQVRCTNRYYSLPNARSFSVGFRCVRSAAEE